VLEAPARTDYMKGILNAPAMGGYKKAGRGESWLSGGAILADILGGAFAGKAMGNTAPPSWLQLDMTPPVPPPGYLPGRR